MKQRKYTSILVIHDVRIMSDGTYWFHVHYKANGKPIKRSYAPSVGFEALPPVSAIWENPPAYLLQEVDRQIAAMLQEGTARFYEHDQEGNRRYEDLRYRDQAWELWMIEICRPLTEVEGRQP